MNSVWHKEQQIFRTQLLKIIEYIVSIWRMDSPLPCNFIIDILWHKSNIFITTRTISKGNMHMRGSYTNRAKIGNLQCIQFLLLLSIDVAVGGGLRYIVLLLVSFNVLVWEWSQVKCLVLIFSLSYSCWTWMNYQSLWRLIGGQRKQERESVVDSWTRQIIEILTWLVDMPHWFIFWGRFVNIHIVIRKTTIIWYKLWQQSLVNWKLNMVLHLLQMWRYPSLKMLSFMLRILW